MADAKTYIATIPVWFWIVMASLIITSAGAWFVKNPKTRVKVIKWGGITFAVFAIYGIVVSMVSPGIGFDILNNPLMNKTSNYTMGNTTVFVTYSTGGQQVQTSGSGALSMFQPTATFTTKDKFASTVITGTAYTKLNSNPYSTQTYTNGAGTQNVNAGDSFTFWVSNATTYVKPITISTVSGVNQVINTGLLNGSISLSGYDLVNRKTINVSTDTTGYSTSMGANKQAQIEYSYLGTYKSSAMPFGGALVIEYNSTIASVTCTGDDINPSNDFHVTYNPTYTASTYRVFKVNPTIDDGSGALRKITCIFQNGATAVGAGSQYIANFIPANYYYTNNGDVVLDTEQFANGLTTRTGLGARTLIANWGA